MRLWATAAYVGDLPLDPASQVQATRTQREMTAIPTPAPTPNLAPLWPTCGQQRPDTCIDPGNCSATSSRNVSQSTSIVVLARFPKPRAQVRFLPGALVMGSSSDTAERSRSSSETPCRRLPENAPTLSHPEGASRQGVRASKTPRTGAAARLRDIFCRWQISAAGGRRPRSSSLVGRGRRGGGHESLDTWAELSASAERSMS